MTAGNQYNEPNFPSKGKGLLTNLYSEHGVSSIESKILLLERTLRIQPSFDCCCKGDISEDAYQKMVLYSLEYEYLVKEGLLEESLA